MNAELGIVKGVAATLPASALGMLASDNEIAYISADITVLIDLAVLADDAVGIILEGSLDSW